MKIIHIFIFFIFLPWALSSQNNSISATAITFYFESKDVDGHISGFSSASTLDFENIENSILKGSVKVKSIKTGIFLRDWHLKGSTYFDENRYPKISFESHEITTTADGFVVKGKLKIKTKEKNTSITFKKNENQLIGTTSLFLSDFGIHIVKNNREDNKVNIKMVFEID